MKKILFFLALSFLWGCSGKKSVDTLIYNAHIYTVEPCRASLRRKTPLAGRKRNCSGCFRERCKRR
jgi:hypothetical protein